MAVDHLIFNRTNFKPYTNDQQVLVFPKKIRVNELASYTRIGDSADGTAQLKGVYDVASIIDDPFSHNTGISYVIKLGSADNEGFALVPANSSNVIQIGGVLSHLYAMLTAFRKEISMAIDHLVFNKLKWCSMNFDEHSINMPNKVKTKLYQAFINMKLSDNVMTTADTGVLYFLQSTVVNVVGKITVSGKTFYQIEGSIPCTTDLGGNVQDHSQTVTSGIVIADNVDVIRGGKTYLTYWYQWLRALITRKVVGA